MASKYLLSTIGNPLGYKPVYVNHVGKKRYYSSVDATIFLGNSISEEIIRIDWTEQEAHMPLYGYNSYVFDEMATGARYIQGQFAINFIIPDYLNALLNQKVENDTSLNYANTGSKTESDRRNPVWNTSFDISVAYGQEDSISGKTPYIFLEEVYVTSQGQALDVNGGGLIEMYTFIARDKTFSR